MPNPVLESSSIVESVRLSTPTVIVEFTVGKLWQGSKNFFVATEQNDAMSSEDFRVVAFAGSKSVSISKSRILRATR